MTDDDIDLRLARLARPHPDVDAETFDVFARAARDGGRRSHRRRVFTGVAGVIVAVIAGLAVAPAAADGIQDFFALTGGECAGGTECIEGDPMIDTNASDIADLVYADYPGYLVLAPGVSKDEAIAETVAYVSNMDGFTFRIVIAQAYEHVAYCGWVNEWLDADAARDQARVDAASGAMRLAVSWPALVSTDGGGTVAQQTKYAVAAEAGDRTGVRSASAMNGCGEEPDREIRNWLEEHSS